MFQLIAYLILVKVSRLNPPSIFKFLHTDLWYFHPFFWHWSLVDSPCLEMEPIRYFQHLLWAPITLFCCALHQALWMWATVSNGRTSVIFSPCFSPFWHLGLARAPIMCIHFTHGNEHVITCLASLFLASCTEFELIHGPRNSRLSPSLSKNSAAQVVAAGFSQLSASWSWSIQLHPQLILSSEVLLLLRSQAHLSNFPPLSVFPISVCPACSLKLERGAKAGADVPPNETQLVPKPQTNLPPVSAGFAPKMLPVAAPKVSTVFATNTPNV